MDFQKRLLIGFVNMKRCSKKKPFTVVLTEETYRALAALANKESRPIAQMARVIIERAVNRKVAPKRA
jgi:predicted DNA-binding protein